MLSSAVRTKYFSLPGAIDTDAATTVGRQNVAASTMTNVNCENHQPMTDVTQNPVVIVGLQL